MIERNHAQDTERCCRDMFEYWLEVDGRASWNKLMSGLEEIRQTTVVTNIRQNILKGS